MNSAKMGKNKSFFGKYAPPKSIKAPIGAIFGAWGIRRIKTPNKTNEIAKGCIITTINKISCNVNPQYIE